MIVKKTRDKLKKMDSKTLKRLRDKISKSSNVKK